MVVRPLLVLIAVLVFAAPAGASSLDRIGAALPTVSDVPDAGLQRRTAEPIGADARRAPFPCADRRARGMRATSRWGEWKASGGARTVRVLVFAYSDAGIGRVWSDLRAAIRTCPRTSAVEEDDGSRGTAVQELRRVDEDAVALDIITRSATGDRRWSRDRAIVYLRVENAIVKAQVSRRILQSDDRALAQRLARVTRGKYLAAPLAAAPAPADDALGAVDRAIAALPAGAQVDVSIGDSMLSGEGGRWRGNVYWHANWPQADAYGEQAYWDTPTGESVRGCHRSVGAPIRIPGLHTLNLACSGAKTTSGWLLGDYKPGIDEGAVDPTTGARLPGQLTLLTRAATQVRIRTIVLSIGGNDLGFADVSIACMTAFLRPWPFEQRCRDDAAAQALVSDAALAAAGQKVEAAIVRVRATMRAAGYADGTWQLIVQNYPRLLAEDNRYDDTYLGRLYAGGCPIHSADVPWFNERLPMTGALRDAVARASAATGQPVRFVDLSALFAGRELCARDSEHVDRLAPGDIVARAERVAMVRVFPPFQPMEGLHPNQLGQQAVQACLRLAINDGRARSGRCEAPLDWGQVDATGLPLVRFAGG